MFTARERRQQVRVHVLDDCHLDTGAELAPGPASESLAGLSGPFVLPQKHKPFPQTEINLG